MFLRMARPLKEEVEEFSVELGGADGGQCDEPNLESLARARIELATQGFSVFQNRHQKLPVMTSNQPRSPRIQRPINYF